MNAKLIFKVLFLAAMLLILVLLGSNNRASVTLNIDPIPPHVLKLSAAMMYYAFFAVGMLTGAVLFAGGGKSSGGGSKGKGDK
jgi:uncharacterized membrane protein YciS (DUF1049 family)